MASRKMNKTDYRRYDYDVVGILRDDCCDEMMRYMDQKFAKLKIDVDDTGVKNTVEKTIEKNMDKIKVNVDIDSDDIREAIESADVTVQLDVPIEEFTEVVENTVHESESNIKCAVKKAKCEVLNAISKHDTAIKNELNEISDKIDENQNVIMNSFADINQLVRNIMN